MLENVKKTRKNAAQKEVKMSTNKETKKWIKRRK